MTTTSPRPLDDLPESRRRILLRLKLAGPSTIAALASEFGMTGEAVRQQLAPLVRQGDVSAQVGVSVPGSTGLGRPAARYRLTELGERFFPRKYEDLLAFMLDTLASEWGSDAPVRVLERLTDARVAALEPHLAGMDLAARVAALGALYEADDPYLSMEPVDGGFRIIERNCPFLELAKRKPLLCSCTVSVLERVLGCEVVREERFQHGDGRCSFRVHADKPIDASRLRFAVERERERTTS